MTMTARRERLVAAAILAAVWGLFVAYAWPGFMTWDSIVQLDQARSGQYGNWHPPIMARLWSVLDGIVRGPALMLVLQTSLFVLGLYGVLRRYAEPLRAALLAALVFLFPPVFAPMSTIWKDSLMAALVLCAVAGLTSPARGWRAAAWLALVVVAALRHNAPILIVPITAMLVPYATSWPGWRRRALGVGLGLAVSLAGMATSRALTRTDNYPLANMLAMQDLGAVIATAPAMTDAEVAALVDGVHLVPPAGIQARLRALDATRSNYEALGQTDQRVFDFVTTEAQSTAMIHAWRRALAEYPGAYLAYRFRRLLDLLGFADKRSIPYVMPHSESAELLAKIGEVRSYAPFQRAIGHGLGRISRSIMFWPMLYFVLAVGLLVILWRDPVQRGLLAGALGYEVALMFLAPGAEYRYSHWMVTCVVIATVVRLLGVARAREAAAIC
ncbi:MAG: hypothetical protein ABIY55_15920 [Kofleriaceae bacterium]